MRSFQKSFAIGLLTVFTLTAFAATRYVDVTSASPTPPYADWATAATNIQDAVDASIAGDLILVTNGVYRTGGRVAASGAVTNRVAVTKAVILRSVNGPEMTVIEGYQVPGSTNGNSAIRCLYLTNGAKFIGFTLTNGATASSIPNLYDRSGGGAWCASTNAYMSNCVISGNVGYFYGGVYGGTLDRCIVAGNRSTQGSGGVYDCRLVNCILTRNLGAAASSSTLVNCTIADNFTGGYGVSASKLYNCIIYYNGSAGSWSGSVLTNCCAVQPPAGSGNITNPPQFLDLPGGDFRLQSGSPCINFGDNSYVGATVDFDGNPRVADDDVDMGAYEYQLPVPFGVEIQATATNIVTTYPLEFKCQFTGGLPVNLVWDFGDGSNVANQSSVAHSWNFPGDFLVRVTGYRSTYPNGVSAMVAVHVAPQIIHYVSASSKTPIAPFLSWNTAATNI